MSQPSQSKQLCAFSGCKTPTSILSVTCTSCNKAFCMVHRLPESHSSVCADHGRSAAHKAHKRDAALIKALADQGGARAAKVNRVGGVEKEREDAKRRLKEKLTAAKQTRTRSSQNAKK
ncbi:hypothetical protein HDU85_000425 [Gaertneriomyces sp. JEL0708]|nr:hypothetical protein HDU85_000425 [Gaertneriomyces sp. JEL0708]